MKFQRSAFVFVILISFASCSAQVPKWLQKIAPPQPPRTQQQQQVSTRQLGQRIPNAHGVSYNVLDLDVVGVKMYMTPAEVAKVLTTRYNAAEGRDLFTQKSMTSGYYHKAKVIEQVTYNGPTFHLVVHFTELYPASDVREEVATSIEYRLVANAGDMDQFTKATEYLRQAALDKYGPLSEGFPTIYGSGGTLGAKRWCTLDSEQHCDMNKPVIAIGGDRLTLSDNGAFTRQMREAATGSTGGSSKPVL